MSDLSTPVPVVPAGRRIGVARGPGVALGTALRRTYAGVIADPLPEAFTDLLARIDWAVVHRVVEGDGR